MANAETEVSRDCCAAMAYGSVITVKSHRVSGGLLHSHTDTYPKEVGPPQQQVCV